MAISPIQETRTDRLVKWTTDLKYNDIPDDVVQRTKDSFLDTLGCAIAGRSHPSVSAMVRFAAQMGPSSGKSELIDGSQNLTTSPAFASLINAAASHVVEQDDLHNRSIMHPVSLLIVLVAYCQCTICRPAQCLSHYRPLSSFQLLLQYLKILGQVEKISSLLAWLATKLVAASESIWEKVTTR